MNAKGILMHIDRTDEIAVAGKAALAARPSSAVGLVFVPAPRTPAGCASFGAGRARDASLLRFVREVVHISAVFPLRHAAIVVTATVPVAHAVRVADEERPDALLDAEVDDRPRGLVPKIAHAPFTTTADLVLCSLQLLPAPGVLPAPALLFGEPSELLASLPFERADTAPGHDESPARARSHGGEVDFPQVNGGLDRAGSFFRLRYLDTNVQLKTPLPHEHAGPGVLWQMEREHERRVAFAHRQDDAPLLAVDGLGGPLDRIERLGAPGVLHAHLRVLPAQFARGLDSAEEGAGDLLHRLGIEGELPARQVMQVHGARPAGMSHPRLLVQFHAAVPHAGRLHLCRFEAAEEGGRRIVQAVDANCLHISFFSLSARNAVMSREGSRASGCSRSIL